MFLDRNKLSSHGPLFAGEQCNFPSGILSVLLERGLMASLLRISAFEAYVTQVAAAFGLASLRDSIRR